LSKHNSETCVQKHTAMCKPWYWYEVHLVSAAGCEICCVCDNPRCVFRVTLINVQRGSLSSRFVMRSLRTRHCVLCLSVVVLEFDVVEKGFEGR